jgi:hypothetical protein
MVDVKRASAAFVAAFHTWRTVGGVSCRANHRIINRNTSSAATYNLQARFISTNVPATGAGNAYNKFNP